jgi:hypothetical protein
MIFLKNYLKKRIDAKKQTNDNNISDYVGTFVVA